MAKIQDHWKPVLVGSPAWRIIAEWAELELQRLRDARERGDVELRKMDQDLGSINTLKTLLKLPDEIKLARGAEPIEGVHFGIPVPSKLWEDPHNVSNT